MINFRQMLEGDMEVFYNTEEIAEKRMIECGGKMKEIPVVFDYEAVEERKISVQDHAEGIDAVKVIIRIPLKEWEEVPEKREKIWIDDIRYEIQNVKCEYGEIVLELGCYDE